MKKLLWFIMLTGLSTSVFANYCDVSLSNLWFYSAMRTNDGITCYYRYCYYGCITDSYFIPGRYKTIGSKWHQKGVDQLECDSTNPYSCEFQYAVKK